MMPEQAHETRFRRAYLKPQIERVSLVPQETVLDACKLVISGQAYDGEVNCLTPFLEEPCVDLVS
jgi:hypothetical protein